MDYKPISQGEEFNISLNRHVTCTLKRNRMSIPFWNHQTFYFKYCWALVRNSWSVFWILSLFALLQGGFCVALPTYCKLKMSTLFRFHKYFIIDFNTKYILVNNLHLSGIFVTSWFSLFHVQPKNQNKFVKFIDFLKKNEFVCQSLIQVIHSQVLNNSLMSFSNIFNMFGMYQRWVLYFRAFPSESIFAL